MIINMHMFRGILLPIRYTAVAQFGIDHMLKPIIQDLKKLESVRIYTLGTPYMYLATTHVLNYVHN